MSFYANYPVEGGGGVTSINTLTGDVTLAAGTNITITPSGNTLTIASTASGANTALSNLASVAINTDLIFGTAVTGTFKTKDAAGDTADLLISTGISSLTASNSGHMIARTGAGTVGNNGSGFATYGTGDAVGSSSSGTLYLITGSTIGAVSGDINLTPGGGGASGTLNLSTPDISGAGIGGPSGNINMNAGRAGPGGGGTNGVINITTSSASASGTGFIALATGFQSTGGTSGGISLSTGTTSGTRGKIKFVDGSEGTSGHVWTSTDTLGNGHWAAAAAAGANVALSNLASVAINANLIFGTAVAGILKTKDATGAVTTALTISTGDVTGNFQSGALSLASGTSDTNNTGAVTLKSGFAVGNSGAVTVGSGDGGGASGIVTVSSGPTSSGNTGIVALTSGDASGDSGAISLTTGTAGGTRGNVVMSANLLVVPSASADPTLGLVAGGIYYNTSLNKLKVYNGVSFETITSI